MADIGTPRGHGLVVVDEWTVVLLAARATSQATADRIVGQLARELRATAARLSSDLAAIATESGVPAPVVVAVDGP